MLNARAVRVSGGYRGAVEIAGKRVADCTRTTRDRNVAARDAAALYRTLAYDALALLRAVSR